MLLCFYPSLLFLLQFAKSKLQAVEMMKKISEHVTDHCILERIVPYLVNLVVQCVTVNYIYHVTEISMETIFKTS